MDLRIDSTGIRSYEFITSSSSGKQVKGTVMQVLGTYPSNSDSVANLTQTDIRDKLNLISFFKPMSYTERIAWLNENNTHREVYLEDIRLKVKFIKIGGDFFNKSLDPEEITLLLKGNPDEAEGFWNIEDVYNMFPRKPGSHAQKHTLIFRPHNWILMTKPDNIVKVYNGVYVTLDTPSIKEGTVRGEILVHTMETERKKITNKLAIVIPEGDPYNNLDIIMDEYPDCKVIKEMIGWFPPSLHKSLIQKLIRTRCAKVEFANKLYDSASVLVTSFCLLLKHPGAFVPDIQRYVTGLESATKRLAVSICEDSYCEDGNEILSLLAAALLAQQNHYWTPSIDLVKRWVNVALNAQQEKKIYNYDWKNFDSKIKDLSAYAACYMLLAEVRSFKSDIDMLGSIAQNDGNFRKEKADNYQYVMPIIHCIDQHSFTEIAHFLNYSPESYSEIFSKIWNKVTGVNPRYKKYKEYQKSYEHDDYVMEIREAQKQLWINKTYTPQERPTTDKTIKFNYKIDKSWVSGLVGPLEVKVGRVSAIVVMRTDNIYEMTAIKRPSRDKNQTELTPEEKTSAINKAKVQLSKGLILTNVPPSLKDLMNATILLAEEKFYIRLFEQETFIPWENFVDLTFEFPSHLQLPLTVDNCLLYTGEGIQEGADEQIDMILKDLDQVVLERMLTYLEGYKHQIKLYKICRDGSSQDLTVTAEDRAVHRLLCYICVLYPACLEIGRNGFNVKNGPLLWSIRDKIRNVIQPISIGESNWEESIPDDRVMWDHQRETFDILVTRKLQGKQGSLIYSPTGSGKCLHPDTPVLLWNGTVKLAKNIVFGDLLIGDDNTPRSVLSTCTGRERMYKIKQLNADDYIVNEPHILTLKYSGHKEFAWNTDLKSKTAILSWTDEKTQKQHKSHFDVQKESSVQKENSWSKENVVTEIEKFIQTHLSTGERKTVKIYWHKNFDSLYWCLHWVDSSVNKYFNKNFSIEEYGSKDGAYAAMMAFRKTIPDNNVIDISVLDVLKLPKNVQKQLKGFASEVNWPKKQVPLNPYMLGAWLGNDTTPEFTQNGLTEMNLIGNKHIPVDYLTNDRETRLELLAGLIDTHGDYDNYGYEITFNNEKLAREITYLCRSLGFHVRFTPTTKIFNDSSEDRSYNCYITGQCLEQIPCLVPQKRAHLCTTDALVTDITIEPLGEGEYCGFTLDGNARFLLGDFTVTHNTMICMHYITYLISNNLMPEYCVYTLPPSALESIVKEIEYFHIPYQILNMNKTGQRYKVQNIRPNVINIILHDQLRKIGDKLKELAPKMLFIVDEFHKTLNKTLRTSITLETVRLSHDFIGLSGTIIKDGHPDDLIEWLSMIVDFQVNEKNYWVGIGALIARKFVSKIAIEREDISVPMADDEAKKYYELVPAKLGGTANHIDFRGAVKLCYDVLTEAMLYYIIAYAEVGEPVFVVAKDINHQTQINAALNARGFTNTFLITKDNSINYEADDERNLIVITTQTHSAGYSLSRIRIMIQSVYFSNQNTRSQLHGRIVRLNSPWDTVKIITLHTGILTYIHEKYEKVRNLSEALKAFAKDIDMEHCIPTTL
jgi:hypothetical protein